MVSEGALPVADRYIYRNCSCGSTVILVTVSVPNKLSGIEKEMPLVAITPDRRELYICARSVEPGSR